MLELHSKFKLLTTIYHLQTIIYSKYSKEKSAEITYVQILDLWFWPTRSIFQPSLAQTLTKQLNKLIKVFRNRHVHLYADCLLLRLMYS